MEQTFKSIKDISNIKFISSTFNNVSLDLSNGNINNVDKIRFSDASIKYLKIEFGRYVIIENMKFYTIENNFLSYRLHYKLPGIPIYQLYHGVDFSNSVSMDNSSTDISGIDNMIVEFENKVAIPNIFKYRLRKTDEIFHVTYNSVNIKWRWTDDDSNIVRYSTSMPPGVYTIKDFNDELKNLIFDVKYGPNNIFINQPIKISGPPSNYPNFTFDFENISNNSIIIYGNSALFKFLTITTDVSFTLSANDTHQIFFEYLPYTNDVSLSYSINTIDGTYNYLNNINPFYDIKPIASHDNVINYNEMQLRKIIEIQDKNLIDINDNTAFKLSLTPDETIGIYNVLGELSSKRLTGKYGTHNSLTITDVSTNTLNVSSISVSKLDLSYIDVSNLTISDGNNFKTSNSNLESKNISVSSISFETLDISGGTINILNNNNYNLNYKNYKFIIFDFKNINKKPMEFNNFRFSDINSNNPVFSTYLLNKDSKYFRLGEISRDELSYDTVENAVNVGDISDISLSIKIPFIEDLSAIIFEFLDPPARGLSFYYNPVDYSNKIFQIDDSNNFIYYTKNDPSFTDISAIIRYTIPSASYTLHELTELLEKLPNIQPNTHVISPDFSGVLQTYFIDANTTTPIASSLNIDISNSYKIVDISNNNTYPTDISKISYMSLSGEISNNNISLNSAEINILGEFLDSQAHIIQSYERYDKLNYNKAKFYLFIRNTFNSYSIHYGKDLSSSFFNYFFEEDISFIVPTSYKNMPLHYNYSLSSLDLSFVERYNNDVIDITSLNSIYDVRMPPVSLESNINTLSYSQYYNGTPLHGNYMLDTTVEPYPSQSNPNHTVGLDKLFSKSFTKRWHTSNSKSLTDVSGVFSFTITFPVYYFCRQIAIKRINGDKYHSTYPRHAKQITITGVDTKTDISNQIATSDVINSADFYNTYSFLTSDGLSLQESNKVYIMDVSDIAVQDGGVYNITSHSYNSFIIDISMGKTYGGVNGSVLEICEMEFIGDVSINSPFSALLTLKDEHNHNLEYDLFSVTNTSNKSLDISGDFGVHRDTWDTIYTNDVLKNHYVLIDGSGVIDNSHDTIHYSVSFDEAFLKIDNSNLIYNKLDKIGPTDNSSSIESKKKYIYMYQDLSIVELSCNDISYENIGTNTNDYYLNNVDISNVSNVVSIKTLVLDTHSNSISFQNTGSNLKLAYFSSDLSHSGTRMDIYSHQVLSGWCIDMNSGEARNQHLSGYGKLEFTKQEFTENSTSIPKTIFYINSGIVLTNQNLSVLSDDQFIDASNSLSNLYNSDINDSSAIFAGETAHLYTTGHATGAPPKNLGESGSLLDKSDVSYGYVIMDVILRLFPIKYTKLNSNDHSKFGSVVDSGYNLYDVSNITPQLKYLIKDDSIKGVTYSSLTPYLCKAIQELSAAVLQLEIELGL